MDILVKTWNEIQALFSELHHIETSCTLTFWAARAADREQCPYKELAGLAGDGGTGGGEGFPNGLSLRMTHCSHQWIVGSHTAHSSPHLLRQQFSHTA